jgi:peptidoglycan/LPS O-acetylase OafA/YrhL
MVETSPRCPRPLTVSANGRSPPPQRIGPSKGSGHSVGLARGASTAVALGLAVLLHPLVETPARQTLLARRHRAGARAEAALTRRLAWAMTGSEE